jgi:DNA-binding transcriptional MocR family regulator
MRGPAATIDRLAEVKAMNDLGSPFFDQLVATRLVPQLERLRADHTVMLQRNLSLVTSLLSSALPAWEWRLPKGGPSLWVRLPKRSAVRFAKVAGAHGVAIAPGRPFAPDGSANQHLSLPLTLPAEHLEEAARRLATAWAVFRTPRGR